MSIPSPAFGLSTVSFGGSRTPSYTPLQVDEALTAAGFDKGRLNTENDTYTYSRAAAPGAGKSLRVEVPHVQSNTIKLPKRVAYEVTLAVKEAKRQDALAKGKTVAFA